MKKKSTLIMIIITHMVLMTFAQEPAITWVKRYKPVGISGTETVAVFNDGMQLSDGGYIAAGLTTNPYLKGYLVRTDANGDTLWTRQFFSDPVTYGSFTCTDIEQTADGGFVLAGHGTHLSSTCIWILKVNAAGALSWAEHYSTVYPLAAYVTYDMRITPDGGFAITGAYQQNLTDPTDAFVIKFNSSGLFQWFETYGSPVVIEQGCSIENALNGGLIIACTYDSTNYEELLLIKLSDLGQMEWDIKYANQPPDVGDRLFIRKTNDQHYIITGQDFSVAFLLKTDAFGSTQWYQTYGSPSYPEEAYSVSQTADNGYVICGKKMADGTTNDIIKVIKTDANGNEEWNKLIPFDYFGDYAYRIQQTADLGYILFGQSRMEQGGADYGLMIKLGGSSGVDPVAGKTIYPYLEQNRPNPFNSSTSIIFGIDKSTSVRISITDLEGRSLIDYDMGLLQPGQYETVIDGTKLHPGIYYYTMETDQGTRSGKMIRIE